MFGSFTWISGLVAVSGYLVALLAGSFLVPVLLPWLPFRSFAANGALVGIIMTFCWLKIVGRVENTWQTAAAYCFMVAAAAFFALTFTGSTPYTSRSGVKKEMRFSMPTMAVSLAVGLLFWIIGTYL
jgi:acetyl-CoA decarbonylase/synthase complex subunit gamma